MKFGHLKHKVLIVILLATFSLIGIVATQLFWINKAHKLKHEHFDNKVKIALKIVVNQLIEHNREHQDSNRYHSFNQLNKDNIHELIEHQMLDSLLRSEFAYYDIREAFDYGIFSTPGDSIIMGNCEKHQKQLFHSKYITKLSCMWNKECYFLSVYFPGSFWIVIRDYAIWIASTVLFIIISIASFSFTIISLIRQKKISEMKNDFINNMTHEFKTPISTISLTSEMLMSPGAIVDPKKISRYAKVIFDENNRLKVQVDKILQTAQFEKGSDRINLIEFDFNQFLRDYATNYLERNHDKDIKITTHLLAKNSIIMADIIHIESVMNNLLDNAVKYSDDKIEITIITKNEKGNFTVKVSDKGIGIKEEYLPHIFEQFYRVPTGNLHNVKGFGIGLYYVKKIMQLHGGDITVKSIINKGTSFKLVFP